MRISFVGGGVMGEAIVRGILDAKLAAPGDIMVGEPLAERPRPAFQELWPGGQAQ